MSGMNVDTEELAICTHQVWCAARTAFLNHHQLNSLYHRKFFARLEAKQGYKYIAPALAQHTCPPAVSSVQYIQQCPVTPITESFLPDLIGYDTSKNDKKNVANFLNFVQTILHTSVTEQVQTIDVSSPFVWPNVAEVLQQRCQMYTNQCSPLYQWAEEWTSVCGAYIPKIQRQLNQCISNCGLLNENVVVYLLRHHLDMETQNDCLQSAITSAQFNFDPLTQPTRPVEIGPYTMRSIVDKLCDNIFSSVRWDMECLETSLQNVLKCPPSPIAFSPQKRHNI